MVEFYAEIKFVHVAAVSASGALFLLRGLALNLGAEWPLAVAVRYLSYSIDMTLLTAALMLMTIVGQYPFVDSWLTTKVLLLIVYVMLGYWAFWRGRTQAVRLRCWLAALAVYGFIVSVALARHPLGILSSVAALIGSGA